MHNEVAYYFWRDFLCGCLVMWLAPKILDCYFSLRRRFR